MAAMRHGTVVNTNIYDQIQGMHTFQSHAKDLWHSPQKMHPGLVTTFNICWKECVQFTGYSKN